MVHLHQLPAQCLNRQPTRSVCFFWSYSVHYVQGSTNKKGNISLFLFLFVETGALFYSLYLLEKVRHNGCPTGLMASTHTTSGITMEVLVK